MPSSKCEKMPVRRTSRGKHLWPLFVFALTLHSGCFGWEMSWVYLGIFGSAVIGRRLSIKLIEKIQRPDERYRYMPVQVMSLNVVVWLLLGNVAALVLSTLYLNPAPVFASEPSEAIAGLEKLGAEITIGPRHEVSVSFHGVSDEQLRLLSGLEDVVQLFAEDPRVTDGAFAYLAHLKQLESLSLSRTSITDAGLRRLVEFPKLRELFLKDTAASDAAASQIGRMEKLTALNLEGTRITDAGLAQFIRLYNLEFLRLDRTSVSGHILVGLRKQFPALRVLSASYTRVGDRELATIAAPASLEQLELQGTRITDSGTPCLEKLTNLMILNLAETKVTDETLTRLANLKSLMRLDVRNTKTTAAGVQAFLAAVPRCIVSYDSDQSRGLRTK